MVDSPSPPAVTPNAPGAAETRQVVLPEWLAQRAEQIKLRRGGSIGSIIAKHAGPGIDEEFREVLKEMHDELNAPDIGESA